MTGPGWDASKKFHNNHSPYLLRKYEHLRIGTVAPDVGSKKAISILSRVLGWKSKEVKEKHWIGKHTAVLVVDAEETSQTCGNIIVVVDGGDTPPETNGNTIVVVDAGDRAPRSDGDTSRETSDSTFVIVDAGDRSQQSSGDVVVVGGVGQAAACGGGRYKHLNR